MKEFNLKILTGEKKIYEGKIKQLSTCDTEGQIGVYAEHSPYVTMLKPCKTTFQEVDGELKALFTSGGIMKISKNEVSMLCEAAEFKSEIDRERAERAKERAEKRLKLKEDGTDLKRAETALKKALLRIKISS